MRLLPILVALAAFLVPQDPKPAPEVPPVRPADVESVDAIVGALYDVVSGPPGARDWARMRSLFLPGARMVALGKDADGVVHARELTVDDYVRAAGTCLERDGFHETEIGRDVRRYGDLVQVLSAYEIRRGADDRDPLMRGVNALQLVRAEGRFWIASLAWEQEHDGGPIPESLRARRGR